MAEFKLSLVGLDKLIEVVAQGIGALAKPWMIRRVAKARAEGMRILASAELEISEQLQLPASVDSASTVASNAAKLLDQPQTTTVPVDAAELFEKRIEQRIYMREHRRQRNLEVIALEAAKEMANVETVSEEAVDDSWVERFFRAAQDVGDPTLRRLWSRILVREVAKPNSTSVRSLEVLRNLSRDEASLFRACLAELCEMGDSRLFIVGPNSLAWRNRHLMTDSGLFGLQTTYSVEVGHEVVVRHGGIALSFRAKPASLFRSWHLTAIQLSEAGRAIANIDDTARTLSKEFLRQLADEYSKHFDILVQQDGCEVPLDEFLSFFSDANP